MSNTVRYFSNPGIIVTNLRCELKLKKEWNKDNKGRHFTRKSQKECFENTQQNNKNC